MGTTLGARGRVTSTNIGTQESAGSLTRELEAPRTVAASTSSRICRNQAPPALRGRDAIEQVITHGAGLDVHQATVVATVRVPGPDGGRHVETRTFATMTPDLLALCDWLQAHGVTHVAMESTGVYWRPIYYVLEDAFTLLLIHMQHLNTCRAAKPMCRTVSGWRRCSNAGCCGAVWSRRRRFANCGI